MADDDPQDIADREKIFKNFDANGDGQISSSELGEALKTLGSVTPEEVQRMMEELDTDGDGFISYEEFTAFARENRGLVRDDLGLHIKGMLRCSNLQKGGRRGAALEMYLDMIHLLDINNWEDPII
ncbi:Polcalcin Ole e 3 [Stylosanthes scabra]|uniref:Polcalcin Ole e 3 n=1 Tax=Stylosanthes scabra TaxID=79078 RepID=A0ABU6RC03_9FABA|nr:Polcalcin Ole e 3 [Stylosanthes scabra]